MSVSNSPNVPRLHLPRSGIREDRPGWHFPKHKVKAKWRGPASISRRLTMTVDTEVSAISREQNRAFWQHAETHGTGFRGWGGRVFWNCSRRVRLPLLVRLRVQGCSQPNRPGSACESERVRARLFARFMVVSSCFVCPMLRSGVTCCNCVTEFEN